MMFRKDVSLIPLAHPLEYGCATWKNDALENASLILVTARASDSHQLHTCTNRTCGHDRSPVKRKLGTGPNTLFQEGHGGESCDVPSPAHPPCALCSTVPITARLFTKTLISVLVSRKSTARSASRVSSLTAAGHDRGLPPACFEHCWCCGP